MSAWTLTWGEWNITLAAATRVQVLSDAWIHPVPWPCRTRSGARSQCAGVTQWAGRWLPVFAPRADGANAEGASVPLKSDEHAPYVLAIADQQRALLLKVEKLPLWVQAQAQSPALVSATPTRSLAQLAQWLGLIEAPL